MSRRNMRGPASACPTLCPDHVRTQALPEPAARRIARCHERRREREPPRGRLAFEASAATPVPDQVTDLVQRDEIAHLAPDGRDTDLEPSLAAAVTVPYGDHDSPTAPADAVDPVATTEIVDVTVERAKLHRASVVSAWEVGVARDVGAGACCVS